MTKEKNAMKYLRRPQLGSFEGVIEADMMVVATELPALIFGSGPAVNIGVFRIHPVFPPPSSLFFRRQLCWTHVLGHIHSQSTSLLW